MIVLSLTSIWLINETLHIVWWWKTHSAIQTWAVKNCQSIITKISIIIRGCFSYRPVCQAWASISARGEAEGWWWPRAWYRADVKTAVFILCITSLSFTYLPNLDRLCYEKDNGGTQLRYCVGTKETCGSWFCRWPCSALSHTARTPGHDK